MIGQPPGILSMLWWARRFRLPGLLVRERVTGIIRLADQDAQDVPDILDEPAPP
jgi:hypothetical protein